MLYKGTQKICPIVTKGTEPTITSLTVTPSTTAQTYTAPTGIDGYSPVNVNAVTSSIDANISSSNIKSGVSILGVNGTVTELAGTTTTITSNGTYTPTGGANGFTSVSVNVAGTTPSGTYTITSNGTYDVTDYATANVSVSGGGTTEDSNFTIIKTLVDRCSLSDMTTTYRSGSLSGVCGIVPIFNEVYVSSSSPSNLLGIALPNSATTSTENYTINGYSYKKITFTNEKWIVLYKSGSVTSSPTDLKYTTNSYSGSVNLFLQYLAFNYNSATSFSSDYILSVTEPCSIQDFYIGSRITFTDSENNAKLKVTLCLPFLSANGVANIIDRFSSISSATTVKPSDIYLYSYSANFEPEIPAGNILLDTFPFVLTYNGESQTNYTGGITSKLYALPYQKFLNLRIILPSDTSFVLPSNILSRGRNNPKFLLSQTALQFMADNAPTVSGKTLTLNAPNIITAGGSSGTIISTLTNKGWTVN